MKTSRSNHKYKPKFPISATTSNAISLCTDSWYWTNFSERKNESIFDDCLYREHQTSHTVHFEIQDGKTICFQESGSGYHQNKSWKQNKHIKTLVTKSE